MSEDETRFAPQLQAYRRAKWAELSDEGEARLRLELARLEHWLAQSAARNKAIEDGDEDAAWFGVREMEVDGGFREAKARVLREILLEVAAAREGAGRSGPS